MCSGPLLLVENKEGSAVEGYRTIATPAQDEFIEKKSRFIGHIAPVQTEEEAVAFVGEIRARHREATHNVYAYILRQNQLSRFSDDGEPQGTAGIPVIDTMKKSGVTDAVVVATRYFGGILLGGGGLIRAYSHTATIALAAAERVRMKQCLRLDLTCSYELYGRVQAIVPECGGITDDTQFTDSVAISLHLEPERLEALTRRLADATSGRAALQRTGEEFYPLEIE